tara:strand:+ start:1448 stop:1933 length:486 start_codon:yes stop_codon:yes gene_type:complete
MAEILILLIVFCFLVLGFLGAILPIIPGPLMSYFGVLGLHFFTDINFSHYEILVYGVMTLLVFMSDYLLQFLGVKKLGGQKNALLGTVLGVFIGFFFAPIGLILGPFIGAFLGSLIDNKEKNQAFRIALGALLGFLFGTFLKLIYSIYIIYIVINKLVFLS